MTDYEATKLVQSARQAAFPWMGASRKVRRRKEYVQTDSERQIERCLHCPYEECFNCFNARNDLQNAFRTLLNIGFRQEEICKTLGICRSTFFKFKSQCLKGA